MASKLTLTILLGDERIDIGCGPHNSIGEVIHAVVVALDVPAHEDDCHLACYDKLYFPDQQIDDLDIENGMSLQLRLPQ